jgi:outer membrane protein
MKSSLFTFLVIGLAALAGAEPAATSVTELQFSELPLELRLPDAVALALECSPRLKQSEETRVQQDLTVRETKAARHPQLGVSGGYSKYDENRLQSFGGPSMSVEDSHWSAGVEASVTVFSGGRNHHAVKREKRRYEASEQGQKVTREALLAEVYQLYYNAELAQQTIQVQKDEIVVLNEQLTVSRNRQEAGAGNRFDVLQAEVALANAQPPLIRAKNDYRRQLDALRRLLGMRYPGGKDANDVQLHPSDTPEALDMSVQEAGMRALASRPELEQLEALIRSERSELSVLRRQHAPVVDVFANYGFEGNQFGTEDLEGWTAGLRLNWSLWSGGRSTSQTRRSKSRIRQLEFQKLELVLSVSGEIRDAYYAYEEALSILESSKESREQASEALRLSRNRFKAGIGTQLDILGSQHQLTQSKLETSRAQNSLQRAIVSIKRASGIPL